jgi:hypothetical protein
MGNVPKDKLKQVFFSTFKVKKKAEKYYSNVTANSADDKRYAELGQNKEAQITYNWPYDFFSLVELVNIEASESKDKKLELQVLNNP